MRVLDEDLTGHASARLKSDRIFRGVVPVYTRLKLKAKLLAVKSGLFVNLATAAASVPVAFARLPLTRDVANAKASRLAVEMRWSMKVE